jgi:hypothetical protein
LIIMICINMLNKSRWINILTIFIHICIFRCWIKHNYLYKIVSSIHFRSISLVEMRNTQCERGKKDEKKMHSSSSYLPDTIVKNIEYSLNRIHREDGYVAKRTNKMTNMLWWGGNDVDHRFFFLRVFDHDPLCRLLTDLSYHCTWHIPICMKQFLF